MGWFSKKGGAAPPPEPVAPQKSAPPKEKEAEIPLNKVRGYSWNVSVTTNAKGKVTSASPENLSLIFQQEMRDSLIQISNQLRQTNEHLQTLTQLTQSLLRNDEGKRTAAMLEDK